MCLAPSALMWPSTTVTRSSVLRRQWGPPSRRKMAVSYPWNLGHLSTMPCFGGQKGALRALRSTCAREMRKQKKGAGNKEGRKTNTAEGRRVLSDFLIPTKRSSDMAACGTRDFLTSSSEPRHVEMGAAVPVQMARSCGMTFLVSVVAQRRYERTLVDDWGPST